MSPRASLETRPCGTVSEFVQAASIMSFYYRRRERDLAWAEMWLENFELGRMLAAFEDGAIVGTVGAFGFSVSVPHRSAVPACGLTHGAVLPSHRRHGIFAVLMMRQLQEARERGEPLAYGIPASEALLRRYGFGVSTFGWASAIPRDKARFREPYEQVGRLRHVSVTEALDSFPGVYDRAMTQRPGMLERSRSWWEFMTLQDPEYRRGGGGAAVRALLEVDGAPEGYAIYRLMPAADDRTTTESVKVLEAVATSDRAEAALWRYLLDIDHVSLVEGDLRIDHPLPLLLDEPRYADFRLHGGAWLRILDLERAFALRTYAGKDAIVLEVADALFESNAARWKIEPGGAARTTAEPDVALGIADLSSIFLGGLSFNRLRSTGRVDERRDRGVERADALFGHPPAPWCPQEF